MIEEEKKNILCVENLTIGYKTKKSNLVVAENIDFSLVKSQLVGLVGANGIGKSTLLRTLINVQPSLTGHIKINNENLEEINALELAKKLSIVLTEPLSTANLSVYELVALGRHPYTNWIGKLSEADEAIISKALDLVKISDLSAKKCYELSDGQLQKVMIARALVQDTDIIILDEPTTHLDMYHKAYILKLLKDLTKETGKTILFSSHEIDLAIQLCDTMIVMTNEGVICNEPCNLIANGVFESLFPNDLILFDNSTGSFRVNKS